MNELDDALAVLADGKPIIIPTETVYGIAARPDLPGAVDAIFRAKGRPEHKALPILGADLDALQAVGRIEGGARLLAHRFWPGPLTLVVARAEGFGHFLGGTDSGTVAVRVPAFGLTLELLARSGPLAVTSANRSAELPARTPAEARAALGHAVEVILDGGPVEGVPSTVVSVVEEPKLLREGAISFDRVVANFRGGPHS